jgi:cation diffusion facilitator CzcD-associated flavoprotein CzcO
MPDTATVVATPSSQTVEHFDVLIVGAGISGVGGAYHLTHQCPGTSFVVLETQESFGGTWLTHKYPGIRSDSDLYTFGYRFKPWTGKPIATAAEILAYMGEVIEENDLGRHIRYRHRIDRALWSSADNRWSIEGVRTDTGEAFRITAGFLWMCQGYYRHSEGYTPEWPGMADFKGRIVHPQTWPDDIDVKGKKVVVIGSGATAATLVPAIANDVEHVTMLQRSPTYFIPARNANDLADQLRTLEVDESWIHENRAPPHPARPVGVHPPLLRGAGEGEGRTAGRRARLPRARLRHRDPLHALLPAVAPAHRLRARRRPVPRYPQRQGLGGDRRDRSLHRKGHSAQVRPRARGRHHRHRHRLPPQCPGGHRLRDRRQAARLRPDPSPTAA